MMNCFACNVEKDPHGESFYPYADDCIHMDDPIPNFFVLECEGWEPFVGDHRAVVVCHECFHKLEPDMWISSRCWASLNPHIPFERLPLPLKTEEGYTEWRAEMYAPLPEEKA